MIHRRITIRAKWLFGITSGKPFYFIELDGTMMVLLRHRRLLVAIPPEGAFSF